MEDRAKRLPMKLETHRQSNSWDNIIKITRDTQKIVSNRLTIYGIPQEDQE